MILIYLEKYIKKRIEYKYINLPIRFALSGMTAQWYFHRNEISSTSMSVWRVAIIKGMTTSFGTIALAGFLMSLVHFLQFVTRQLKKACE